jgi:hypothetical protein
MASSIAFRRLRGYPYVVDAYGSLGLIEKSLGAFVYLPSANAWTDILKHPPAF